MVRAHKKLTKKRKKKSVAQKGTEKLKRPIKKQNEQSRNENRGKKAKNRHFINQQNAERNRKIRSHKRIREIKEDHGY